MFTNEELKTILGLCGTEIAKIELAFLKEPAWAAEFLTERRDRVYSIILKLMEMLTD